MAGVKNWETFDIFKVPLVELNFADLGPIYKTSLSHSLQYTYFHSLQHIFLQINVAGEDNEYSIVQVTSESESEVKACSLLELKR